VDRNPVTPIRAALLQAGQASRPVVALQPGCATGMQPRAARHPDRHSARRGRARAACACPRTARTRS